MKKSIIAISMVIIAVISVSCGGGSPSSSGGQFNMANVNGMYNVILSESDCPVFDTQLEVLTAGTDYISIRFPGGSYQNLDGKINADGEFTVSNNEGDCMGAINGTEVVFGCDDSAGNQCIVTLKKAY